MAAGIITTGSHPKLQWPGVSTIFGISYAEHAEEFSQIYELDTTKMGAVEDVQMYGFGLAPVKTQGKAVDFVGHTQGWTKRYLMVTYGLGFIVTEEEIFENQYPEVAPKRAQALAFSLRQTKEWVHANVLNRAFNSSYAGGDSKELCATDHARSGGGTYSNYLSPAADISEDAIEDMCTMIMKFTDDTGAKINLMPQMVIVPPDLWFETNRILQSTLQNDTANNAQNVLKSTNALPQGIKMNHYLTDTDAFFIKSNCPRGLVSYQEWPVKFTKDNEFASDNAMAKGVERYGCGWTDPKTVVGCPGA